MTGLWVVLLTLAVGLLAGAALRAREGRIRPADGATPAEGLPDIVAASLAAAPAVTLVQISTHFCSPCRHARERLSALADRTEKLAHVDIDVTHRVEVAQALGVLRTPTTIAFTAEGVELLRVGGVPDAKPLLEGLSAHL